MTNENDETATAAPEKIPFAEAMDLLTQGEIGLIERHYTDVVGRTQHFGGEGPSEMSPMATMTGTIWAMEKRRLGKAYDWKQAEAMTLGQCNAYFAKEPIDVDEEDPDSESGKDDTLATSAPESEPSSVPS
jgi:hypothetical protein